jgi:uncharacterized PurR-regulated membrane protein YhhQ (DUF165 family)
MKLIFMLNKLLKIYFTDYAVKWCLAVTNFTSFCYKEKAFDKQSRQMNSGTVEHRKA